METRVIIAYALCAAMAVIVAFVGIRHRRNKRQFKLRQMGRGKNMPDADQTTAQ